MGCLVAEGSANRERFGPDRPAADDIQANTVPIMALPIWRWTALVAHALAVTNIIRSAQS
jgi:hypothetical protein